MYKYNLLLLSFTRCYANSSMTAIFNGMSKRFQANQSKIL